MANKSRKARGPKVPPPPPSPPPPPPKDPMADWTDDSVYSDADICPQQITRRRCPCRRRRRAGPVWATRLPIIAAPPRGTYAALYKRYAAVLDGPRAARIQRRIDEAQVMSLDELEIEVARQERVKRRRERQKRTAKRNEFAPEPTFEEFASERLDELFEVLAKRLTKRLCSGHAVAASRQPQIVSAANRRLLDYAQEVVDNAMAVQTRCGGCRDFVGECPEVQAEERRVRGRVAEELAKIAKRVLPKPMGAMATRTDQQQSGASTATVLAP